MGESRWLAGCMGFLWVNGFSFFHCVASPFHSFRNYYDAANDHVCNLLIVTQSLFRTQAVVFRYMPASNDHCMTRQHSSSKCLGV